MSEMKVLHVINISGMGGAEKLLLQLLPALNSRVNTQCLIMHKAGAGDAAEQIARELRLKGINVFIFAYRRLTSKGIFTELIRVISQGNYQLIHSHLKYADAWLAWMKFRKKIRIPVVTTMHGYNDAYENENGFVIRKDLWRSPYFLISKWIYRQLDGFILISNIVKHFFVETGLIGNRPNVVIYHGYEATPEPLKIRKASIPLQVAVPGRLLKRKGQQFAIESIAMLRKDGIDISLHLFGEGPNRAELEKLVAEKQLAHKIFLHGYVHGLLDRLKDMDIIVVPSLWEGFGLVFLDAFAAGVPVVGFDLPAANEIIRHEHNGLLAEPYSSVSLANAIRRLYDDAALRESLSAQAFKDLQYFTMDSMVNSYISFYRQITGSLN